MADIEDVEESNIFFRNIFEYSGVAKFIYGEDGIISLVNNEFENFLKYTRNEVEGKKKLTDLFRNKDFGLLMEYLLMHRNDSQIFIKNYRAQVVDRNNAMRDTYVTIALIPGTEKKVASLVDISQLKKDEKALSKNKAYYWELFESIGLPIVHVDAKGRHLFFNDAFAEFTGYSHMELKHMSFSDFFSPNSFMQIQDLNMKQMACQLDCFNIDIHFLCKDNSLRWGKMRAIPVHNQHDSFSAFFVIVDKTIQKQTEENFLATQNELNIKERKLEEAYTSVQFIMEAMERKQNKLQERFICNIRELVLPFLDKLEKTPLNNNQRKLVKMTETYLERIASPFIHNLSSSYFNLTEKEIQVSALVKEGKTSKEIAELLNLSQRAIDFHRGRIRDKLGLKNKSCNLQMLLHNYDVSSNMEETPGYMKTVIPLNEDRDYNHKQSKHHLEGKKMGSKHE